jgi:hypothetical protein
MTETMTRTVTQGGGIVVMTVTTTVGPGEPQDGNFQLWVSVNSWWMNRAINNAQVFLIGNGQVLNGTTDKQGVVSFKVPQGHYEVKVKVGEEEITSILYHTNDESVSLSTSFWIWFVTLHVGPVPLWFIILIALITAAIVLYMILHSA